MKSVSQRLNSTNGEESRKAPLPRFKLKASADEIARQLWEDSLQAILLQGRPSRASTGILEEEGSFKGLHQTGELPVSLQCFVAHSSYSKASQI